MKRKKAKRLKRKIQRSLPQKANRILNGILIVLMLIAFRLWHLSVIQHDEKTEQALRPQKRVIVEKGARGSIVDRDGEPLAVNKLQYNAAITYSQIRSVPRVIYIRDDRGRKVRIYKRREYIEALSKRLGEELGLDPVRLEDTIHSKASLFGRAPFTIKENIGEAAYFRLKMLEKDFPGITAQVASKRWYPKGKIGSDVVGYMGAISQRHYRSVTQEMKELREKIDQEDLSGTLTLDAMKGRLDDLEAKAYTIRDLVGKSGIEGAFDEALRGWRGKRTFLANIQGIFLRELPGTEAAQPGDRIELTLSSTLQEAAEKLLAEYEAKPPIVGGEEATTPWIKGGAIIAMNPNNGEILALASSPRFDPNDFLFSGEKEAERKNELARVLETMRCSQAIWDHEIPLTREFVEGQTWQMEEVWLDWETYLGKLLSMHSPLHEVLSMLSCIKDAVWFQEGVMQLLLTFADDEPLTPPLTLKIMDFLYPSPSNRTTSVVLTIPDKERFTEIYALHQEQIEERMKTLAPIFDLVVSNGEKLLLVDLMRLAVDAEQLDLAFLEQYGMESLSNYRDHGIAVASLERELVSIMREWFHQTRFVNWREEEFKSYLSEKREEEKANKRYARPYLDYLDEMEEQLFETFWKETRLEMLLALIDEDEKAAHLANQLQSSDALLLLRDLGLSREQLRPYIKSVRTFKDLTRPLLGSYGSLKRDGEGQQLEKHLASAFIPRYGFGYTRSNAFQTAATIGSLFKLVPAYESVRQRLDQGHRELNPLTMIDHKHKRGNRWYVGYTNEGKAIPIYYRGGRLPRSDHSGVGSVDLVKALETSSNPYFSLLVGEQLNDPEDLMNAARQFSFGVRTNIDLPGEFAGKFPKDITYNRTGLYATAIGQHSLVGTPLQVAVMLSAIANGGSVLKPQVVRKRVGKDGVITTKREVLRTIPLDKKNRALLLKGLEKVVEGERGTARLLRKLSSYKRLGKKIVGKTTTAQSLEWVGADPVHGRQMCRHVGFGCISFDEQDQKMEHPELVVVVYLYYGDYGNRAAPLALKVIEKWEEEKSRKNRTR